MEDFFSFYTLTNLKKISYLEARKFKITPSITL